MGADYRKAHTSQMPFGTATNAAANATSYFSIGQSNDPAVISYPISVDGVISHLYCHSGLPAGVGDTYTYTVMVNSLATALTCQHGGAVDQDSSDLVNAVAVVAGQIICIRVVVTATGAATRQQASLELRT